MADLYPQFRNDLIVSRQEHEGRSIFIIKDPVTRRFFRFKQTEYDIACLFDGRSSLAAVQRKFQSMHDAVLPQEKLERFLRHLENLDLMAKDSSDGERHGTLSRRLGGPRTTEQLLYIKLKSLDPNRIFTVLIPYLRFCFSRRFVVLVMALVVIALVLTLSYWGEYTLQIGRLLEMGTIPTFLLVVLIVTILHESAHGLTCKHYGGDVHEIGFLLMYFMPAFYCNVSDAWLLPEKSKRIWVSFAGVFCQILLWAVATIAWRVVDPEYWFSDFLCVVMTTCGIAALFNLNPLLKLDGYYMLADYLDEPNLRSRAFGYLGSHIKGLLWSPMPVAFKPTGRQRRIFLLYGTLAAAYSLGLLIFILLRAVSFVFAKFHASGVVLLLGGIVLLSSGLLEKGFAGVYSVFKNRKGGGVTRRRRIFFLAGIIVLLFISVFVKWELKISNRSILLPGSQACIRAEVDGTITELSVDEGNVVAAGELIARLDDSEFRRQMNEAAAERAKWEAELELLKNGPLAEEIVRQEKLVEKAETKVDFARKEYERLRELYRNNLVAEHEYENAKENLNVLVKEWEHAQSELDVVLAGFRPEKLKSVAAEIDRLAAVYKYYSEQTSRTRIVSPIAGVITTHRLADRLQEHLEVGDELCRVVDCRKMLLEMPVSEKDIAHVQVGQRVKFRARSMPESAFHGRVTAVAPVASEEENRKVILVTSEIDNPDMLLDPGMTGNARIYCGKRSLLYLWTRKVIRFVRVEFWW